MQKTTEDILEEEQPFEIDAPVEQAMSDSARWAGFIALLLFLIFGLLSLFVVTGNSTAIRFTQSLFGNGRILDERDAFTRPALTALTIFYMIVYVFLYRFSSRLQKAMRSQDEQSLEESVIAMRLYFMLHFLINTIVLILAFGQLLMVLKKILHY
jgi:hypothetical protein